MSNVPSLGIWLGLAGGILAAIGFFVQSWQSDKELNGLRERNEKLHGEAIVRADEVIRLQRRLVDMQVVGDSYPVISVEGPIRIDGPIPEINLSAFVVGNFHLPELQIWVHDLTKFKPIAPGTPADKSFALSRKILEKNIEFGPATLRVGLSHPIGKFSLTSDELGHLRFSITSQWNPGMKRWMQDLSYRRVQERWVRASKVTGNRLEVLLYEVDPDFPRGADGIPLW